MHPVLAASLQGNFFLLAVAPADPAANDAGGAEAVVLAGDGGTGTFPAARSFGSDGCENPRCSGSGAIPLRLVELELAILGVYSCCPLKLSADVLLPDQVVLPDETELWCTRSGVGHSLAAVKPVGYR